MEEKIPTRTYDIDDTHLVLKNYDHYYEIIAHRDGTTYKLPVKKLSKQEIKNYDYSTHLPPTFQEFDSCMMKSKVTIKYDRIRNYDSDTEEDENDSTDDDSPHDHKIEESESKHGSFLRIKFFNLRLYEESNRNKDILHDFIDRGKTKVVIGKRGVNGNTLYFSNFMTNKKTDADKYLNLMKESKFKNRSALYSLTTDWISLNNRFADFKKYIEFISRTFLSNDSRSNLRYHEIDSDFMHVRHYDNMKDLQLYKEPPTEQPYYYKNTVDYIRKYLSKSKKELVITVLDLETMFIHIKPVGGILNLKVIYVGILSEFINYGFNAIKGFRSLINEDDSNRTRNENIEPCAISMYLIQIIPANTVCCLIVNYLYARVNGE